MKSKTKSQDAINRRLTSLGISQTAQTEYIVDTEIWINSYFEDNPDAEWVFRTMRDELTPKYAIGIALLLKDDETSWRSVAQAFRQVHSDRILALMPQKTKQHPKGKGYTLAETMHWWRVNALNSFTLREWISKALQCYTFSPVMESKRLQRQLVDEYVKHHEMYNNNTFLILQKSCSVNTTAVQQSLVYRHPVYFGYPVKSHYSAAKVKTFLHYDPRRMPTVDNTIRYAITGPAIRFGDDRYPFQAIHVWGVNLESTETADYEMYMRKGRIVRDAYRRTVHEMLSTVLAATQSVYTDLKKKVRMRKVGLGSYLQAVKYEEDVEWAHETFLTSLVSVLDQYPDVSLELSSIRLMTRTGRLIKNSTTQNDSKYSSDTTYLFSRLPV